MTDGRSNAGRRPVPGLRKHADLRPDPATRTTLECFANVLETLTIEAVAETHPQMRFAQHGRPVRRERWRIDPDRDRLRLQPQPYRRAFGHCRTDDLLLGRCRLDAIAQSVDKLQPLAFAFDPDPCVAVSHDRQPRTFA